MDLGVQLGRRFRALKLWTVIRAFGVDGIAARLREHVAMVGTFDMLSTIDRPRFVLDRGTLLHQPDPIAGRVGFGFELGWH
jgi:hypothetical protein